MKKVKRKRNYRLSKAACPGGHGPVFKFPSEAMVKEMLKNNGALVTLIGFENNKKDDQGNMFNFIMSNGARSTQRDPSNRTDHTFMIPADAIKRIRSVTIHYTYYI